MEGHLELAIPGVTASTYYKIIGDLSSTPLIVIHGGPSAGHEYLLPFAALWKRYHIPVIFYDQIGCAGSTRLPEKDGDRSFWTMDLFLAELQQLIDHLGLEDYHILGQSWGGMIAPVFAAKRPKGLRKLILASGISDASTLRAGSRALVDALQDEFKLPIQRAMDTENFGDEFKTAMNGFNQAYVWAHGMPPPELIKAMTNVGETRIHRTV